MKRIIIFVEGYTEAHFIKQFLLTKFIPDAIQIKFIKLPYFSDDPFISNHVIYDPKLSFEVYIVANDEGVITKVKEFSRPSTNNNYEKIYALRDMYSKKYKDRLVALNLPKTEANASVSAEFINAAKKEIDTLSNSSKIVFYFSIMEIEAWFLSFYKILIKIDARLSLDFIKNKLNIDLENDSLEDYFKPSDVLDKIYRLIGKEYSKKNNEVMSYTSYIRREDFKNAKNRCIGLNYFCNSIEQVDASLIINGEPT